MPLGLGSMETIYLSWATNAAPFKVCKSSIKKFLEKYRFCVNLGGDSSPISYHYRVVLLSGHLHLLC